MKCYTESRRSGVAYIKEEAGRLTDVSTVFQDTLLKER
jgi:hypothetical protein